MQRTRLLIMSTLAAAALLGGSSQSAHAGFVLVHESVETYYDNGAGQHGTVVTGCAGLGCQGTTFDFGNPSGFLEDRQFNVEEEVRWDEDNNQTKVTYTVNNYSSGTNLTSFHIRTNGVPVLSTQSPVSGAPWAVTVTNDSVLWESAVGIPANGGTTGWIVIYGGLQDVVYDQVGFDLDGGAEITFSDWVVSTVPANGGGEGCTPGFWKQSQHFGSWPAPYVPGTLFSAVFEDAFPGLTLIDVMLPGGGGKLRQFGRHIVAALLNAASPTVDYDLTVAQVIDMFNDVFPGTNQEYNTLKDILVGFNEQSCPLDGEPSLPSGCVNENGICGQDENCENCPSDCDSKTNGRPSGRYCCGNGVPEGPEGDGRCDGNF